MTPHVRAFALAALVVTILAPFAAAHGYVTGGEPEPFSAVEIPPERVVVNMSEPIELAFSTLRVLDRNATDLQPSDAYHPDGDTTRLAVVIPTLSNGTYTVVWRALWKSDGHETSGFHSFTVGNKSSRDTSTPPLHLDLGGANVAPTLASSIFRAISFIGLVLAPGSLLFHLVLFRPAWTRAAGGRERIFGDGLARSQHVTFILALVGIVLGLVGTIGLLADVAATTLKTDAWTAVSSIPEIVSATSVGRVLALRFLFLIFAAADIFIAFRIARAAWASLLFSTCALVATSFASHAAGVGGSTLSADIVHLLAAGAWAGALPAMILALPSAARLLDAPERDRLYGPLVGSFSLIATISIAALAITGTRAGFAHLDSWSALISTEYGRLLLLKLGLVAPILLLGVLNKFMFTPGFQPDARRRLGSFARYVTPRRFRRVLALEALFVIGVLIVTGVLTGTASRENLGPQFNTGGPDEGPLVLSGRGEEVAFARVVLAPGDIGANTIAATFTNADTGAPLNVTRIIVALTYTTNREIGTVQEQLTFENATKEWTGRVGFGLPGEYDLVVLIETTDAYPDAVIFKLSVPDEGRVTQTK